MTFASGFLHSKRAAQAWARVATSGVRFQTGPIHQRIGVAALNQHFLIGSILPLG
jgi:hypothetical protein